MNLLIGKLWSVNENPVDGLPIFYGHWRARYFYGYWRSWKEWESRGNMNMMEDIEMVPWSDGKMMEYDFCENMRKYDDNY